MTGVRAAPWFAWVVACLLACVFAGSGCKRSDRPRPERLVMYCGVVPKWCNAMAEAFEAETGIDVLMTHKGSGETLAQVRAERRNPRGDVWFGGTGDGHMQASEAKLTESYPSPHLAELHPWAVDPAGHGKHRTTGIYMGALGIAYNREWLAKKGLAPPKGWKDLIDPRFRGELQMANPNSSGTAYTALATIIQLMGEDEGFKYLAALHANINQYTQSGAAPVRAAARGETGVAIVFLHDALMERASGFPIDIVMPEEGTGYEIGCVSIIRGARHPENAKRFVDYALSAKGQEVGASAHAWQWPSNRGAKPPPIDVKLDDVKLIEFDHKRWGSKLERTRLLERWEREVRAGS